jgi:hypothetical protein
MTIEPLPETSRPCPTGPDRLADDSTSVLQEGVELPVELSEFSQRLASFGLGESPDPLLTEARPPARRSRN